MIIFLIIFFFIILSGIFILGIICSKIVLNIYEFEMYLESNEIKIRRFRGKISIYLFKLINLINIDIYKRYCEIFGIKIVFEKIFKLNKYKVLDEWLRKNDNTIKTYLRYLLSKESNIELNDFDMRIDVGTENAVITSLLVGIISSIIPIIIKNNMDKLYINNVKYKVNPNYFNINNFKVNLKTKITFELFDIISKLSLIKNKEALSKVQINV